MTKQSIIVVRTALSDKIKEIKLSAAYADTFDKNRVPFWEEELTKTEKAREEFVTLSNRLWNSAS